MVIISTAICHTPLALSGVRHFFGGLQAKVSVLNNFDDGLPGKGREADLQGVRSPTWEIEKSAVALHNIQRLRMRHFINPVMADHAMSVMLTLFIGECHDMVTMEQGVLLANHIANGEGATLIDTLVQAGLVAVTGKTPGRRAVGLTPLGSARMRAYIIDSSNLM